MPLYNVFWASQADDGSGVVTGNLVQNISAADTGLAANSVATTYGNVTDSFHVWLVSNDTVVASPTTAS